VLTHSHAQHGTGDLASDCADVRSGGADAGGSARSLDGWSAGTRHRCVCACHSAHTPPLLQSDEVERATCARLLAQQLDVLFVAPERLARPSFRAMLARVKIVRDM
jgi:hypothetical protein